MEEEPRELIREKTEKSSSRLAAEESCREGEVWGGGITAALRLHIKRERRAARESYQGVKMAE